MVTEHELLAAVDTAFEDVGRDLSPWPDPHPDRVVLEEEYSRLTRRSRWRILGARADAWLAALTETELAEIEPATRAAVEWRVQPGPVVSRVARAVPHASGALPLILARSVLGGVHDAGVVVGVGDPAVWVTWFPHCGCDACDSGSQDELDHLDEHVLAVVSGLFRHVSRGDRCITVIGEHRWTGSGLSRRHDVAAILADPRGWDEVSGASWFQI